MKKILGKSNDAKFFLSSKNMPYCHKNGNRIREKVKIDIINPFYLLCNNINCKRKQSLRTYSFMKCAKKISASMKYEVIILFIIEKKMQKRK